MASIMKKEDCCSLISDMPPDIDQRPAGKWRRFLHTSSVNCDLHLSSEDARKDAGTSACIPTGLVSKTSHPAFADPANVHVYGVHGVLV